MECLPRQGRAARVSMTFHQIGQGLAQTSIVIIAGNQGGYTVSINKTKGNKHIREVVGCDSVWVTRQVHFQSDDKSNIILKRSGDTILLSGVFRDKKDFQAAPDRCPSMVPAGYHGNTGNVDARCRKTEILGCQSRRPGAAESGKVQNCRYNACPAPRRSANQVPSRACQT